MNELQIFNNPEFGEVRTLEENGAALFCGADVAKALGYAKLSEIHAIEGKDAPQSAFVKDVYRLSSGAN